MTASRWAQWCDVMKDERKEDITKAMVTFIFFITIFTCTPTAFTYAMNHIKTIVGCTDQPPTT